MNTYVDSSVLLRVILSQEPQLAEWKFVQTTVSSVLLFIEGRRAVDRVRLAPDTMRKMIGSPRDRFFQAVERIKFIEIDHNIVSIASQPFPFAMKSLDAIHLATALDWKRRKAEDLVFMTHDTQLAAAARYVGFQDLG